MTDYEKTARELYDCLKDAQEKGAWIDSQLNLIADALKAAVEAEREACAKTADLESNKHWVGQDELYIRGHCSGTKRVAATIRARGE